VTRRALLVVALLGLLAAPGARGAGRRVPLAVGDLAPDFTVMDQAGQSVTLSEVLARRSAVVLAFYIKADTPG
jgi:AhpC/TSA family protein